MAKGGKGLVHIERFLGLVSDYRRTNQIYAMWFACDYHVTLSYSQPLLDVRAVDAKGQSNVLS